MQVALADVDDHFLEGIDIDSLQLVVAGLLEHTGGDEHCVKISAS